jgi:hypothetical protein
MLGVLFLYDLFFWGEVFNLWINFPGRRCFWDGPDWTVDIGGWVVYESL